MRVVGLVAVHIHQAAGALGQVHQKLHRRYPLVAGIFEMRNAADDIGANRHGFSHQRPAVGVRLDALLREGDNLQVDQLTHLVTHLDHDLERGEFRVGHIDMGAHMLDTVVHQHADGFFARVLMSS